MKRATVWLKSLALGLLWTTGFMAWLAASLMQMFASFFFAADRPMIRRYPSLDGQFVAVEFIEEAGSVMVGSGCMSSVWVVKSDGSEVKQIADRRNNVLDYDCTDYEAFKEPVITWLEGNSLEIALKAERFAQIYVRLKESSSDYSVKFLIDDAAAKPTKLIKKQS